LELTDKKKIITIKFVWEHTGTTPSPYRKH